MNKSLKPLIEKHLARINDLRCRIHKNPELSRNEAGTAALVASVLKEAGLDVKEGVGGHGVSALLKGAKDGPCIALRADMDALPMEEHTGFP
ncbi:MAG: amidohydrolase, partial [Synergistales bacterium]|nr:amidohydrolase [Synergistales bacterium]